MSKTSKNKTSDSGAVDLENNVCFEEALGKLELIVKQLETGDLALEESLAVFSEGISLSKICLDKLNAVETQIDLILQEEQGRLLTRPLQLTEDSKD
ncbi:MAG TPA: exodeoxyribonuclease VII small subunit [Methylomusa anaerophila]|uniref:Exodeoxyribonuclease 7 small subunit n=1 Tax=Methylomusa anaerophila TaxID=1930071 RepID=A0A348APC3_9FIRM|nr:exodeoxyribonuclease VII small subunit [Methylomusa anaerophila]BBB92921.1 exodeoxyribonuclease 7 small subunit [Methylomusa anaerophila]HML87244.1 exodeoxyribonuclease VII small subunit [Methylomusa anaerophila]